MAAAAPCPAQGEATAIPAAAARPHEYARDVRPILARACFECHGATRQKKGLRLDRRSAALRGGRDGPVIVPGDPARSRLLRHVEGAGGVKRMPPPDAKVGPLTADEIATLRSWIAQGAPWTDDAGDAGDADARHWAYRPIPRVAAPVPGVPNWPRNPLDHFILARLHAEGLAPSPEADRLAWLRRVTLDLTGLPPTPEEATAFAADPGPQAYEAVVDRLLASPHYGERWARIWLDLARYADSSGYERDQPRVMWRWRDWVIDAFNRDLPYDRFTIEQIAGDLLPDADDRTRIATGFHRNTMTNDEGGTDDEEFRVAAVIDRVNTTMQAWMGTTLGCAQCHDHKYDPFSQREYYQLFAFFNNTADADRADEAPRMPAPTPEEVQHRARLAAVEARLARVLDESARDLGVASDAALLQPLRDAMAGMRQRRESSPWTSALVLEELPAERRRTTRILEKGSFLSPGEPVRPDTPAALHPFPEGAPRDRLGLALWLASPANPLAPRVAVNRVWEALFGRGLVETAEDFGVQGEPPTHPGLLDWLASEFVDGGFRLKPLLRTIVLSATYRQSSALRPGLREHDPDNRLLARGPRVRLDAEFVRDNALAASGLLARKVGGPSVMPPQPDGVWQVVYSGDQWTTSRGEDRHRRGLYTFWRRSAPYPSMVAFDAPSREYCVVRRVRTNTPLQALVTLNDPVYVEAAQALARRLLHEAHGDRERIARGFWLCLQRPPHPDETAAALAALARERAAWAADEAAARAFAGLGCDVQPAGQEPGEVAAFTALAGVLLNLDEFLTKG
ncbi:MAG: PSD1 domain-containing protein [Planctomycetes bacterium]|nr:PSD1 domain-containing protein [Planctomycetota bacterium]